MLKTIVFQKKVLTSVYPAIFHTLIFYSFAVLFLTTAVIAIDYDLGIPLFRGHLYSLLSISSEVSGILIIIGVSLAFFRRYKMSPKTLDTSFSDYFALMLIALIVITGFIVEGLRIEGTLNLNDSLSPVGTAFGEMFIRLLPNSEKSSILQTHEIFWWIHTCLVFLWISIIPYTKFIHMLLIPANVFSSKQTPPGTIPRTDIETLLNDD